MYELARHVRFSINPFLPKQEKGSNSFVSQPAGEGLSLFFELSVEVTGEVDPATGFVVNVTDIDMNIRRFVVPLFVERVTRDFRQARHIGFSAIVEILEATRSRLADKFGTARLSRLSLKLNPFRTVTVDTKDLDMAYFCEKFEFAATHKLWNDNFSEQRNLDVFGKCANPTGHGHNYVAEVEVSMPAARDDFRISDFERTVDNELIKLLDHRNLNTDLDHFSRTNPTVENIAVFAWNRLVGKLGKGALHRVTVWETDKTYCSYYG
jgi:6-pyruvoyltetrahydropterin/6-carboxytetrahydropterin synthase